MLFWKNKPISELSKCELEVALSESVRFILTNKKSYPKNIVLSAFLMGSFSGMLITGIIIAATLTL